ncbi:hypothetical protein WA026_007539 [Henosepilachna vigintioctopunctata]|uniref:FLYWCH-type domain-containing protein n=1 Tax=Henosepilachna vigintioctopunctata TaxID=420089 RepID=A0AAW1UPF1_9CUCU
MVILFSLNCPTELDLDEGDCSLLRVVRIFKFLKVPLRVFCNQNILDGLPLPLGGTIFILKGTKNPKIILENNDYQINRKMYDRTLWRCSNYFRTKCKATLITKDIIHIINGRKNPQIILKDNLYIINRRIHDRTMWRCASYYRTRCKARAITFGKIMKITSDHNHVPMRPNYDNAVPQKVCILWEVKKFEDKKMFDDFQPE